MTRQETINVAVYRALSIANDPTHGYDQANRWGPNYDCSSFIIMIWQMVGVLLKDAGATYTGNMLGPMLRLGFQDVKDKVNLRTGSGLEKGDVLLNVTHHVEMYVGNGQNVKASINEHGGVTGGQTGDQTGREIYVGSYYEPSYGWDYVLRYMGGEADKPGEDAGGGSSDTSPPTSPAEGTTEAPADLGLPMLRRGDKGRTVRMLQADLIDLGYSCGPDGADGEFGDNTHAAVCEFQSDLGLEIDGIVGPQSWYAIMIG